MVLLLQYCFPYPFTYVYHIFLWTNKLYKSQSYIYDVIPSPWFSLQLLLCNCYFSCTFLFLLFQELTNYYVLLLCGTRPDNYTVIYFALWHSLSSINWEIKVFRLEQAQFSWRDFVKHAWPFSLISFVGIAILLAAGSFLSTLISPFLLFFIAISVLTLPHMVYMQQFYSLKEGKFPMTEVSKA